LSLLKKLAQNAKDAKLPENNSCQFVKFVASFSRLTINYPINQENPAMTQKPLKLLLILLLLFSLLVACRRQPSETPTPTPPPATVTPAIVVTPTTVSTAEPVLNIDWPPQVVLSSPAPGEEALLAGAVTIRFDQPMDQRSVESAFTIQPAGLSSAVVPGNFSWPRADTLVFTPGAGLERQQRYKVQIAATARGQNGQSLRQAVDLDLQTVGFLEVSQVIPAANVNDIQTDAAITVLFNRPVVPIVTTAQQSALPRPLRFDPPVEGTGEWVSSSIYRFVPAEPLAGATTYQATIAAGLEDVTGGVLDDSFSWQFTTLRPSVVSIAPFQTRDSGHIAPTETITVTFNMPMDRQSTEAAISLNPAAPVRFNWRDDGRTVGVTPSQRLNLGTSYELIVAPSARSVNGQATLDRETRERFATVPLPAVLEVTPRNNAVAERYQRGVSVRFASPMNFATLEDQIRIQPAPDRVNYFFDEYNNYLYLDFELKRNSQYAIIIPGTAADPYGNTLGQDYTWRFTTPPPDPLASFNLPQYLSQLSTSHPTQVEIVHRNVSRLDVELFEMGLPIGLLQEPYRLPELSPGLSSRQRWQLSPATAPDQVGIETLTLANGDVLPTGVYLLRVQAPETGRESVWWQNQANLVIVADTNLVVKEMFDAVHVWATDLATGQPAAGRLLTLYSRDGRPLGPAVTSDSNGFGRFPYQPTEDYLQGVFVASSEPGQTGFGLAGSAWNPGVTPWHFAVPATFQDEPARTAYLYTDRPIYRPGDTVHYRGIVRENDYGRYNLPRSQPLTLAVDYGSYFESGSRFFEVTVTPDANGNFSGEFSLPAEAQLGSYRMTFAERDIETDLSFTVAEYRAPEFLVSATAEQTELLRGQAVDVVIEAAYFFGGPATDLEVNWSVYAQPYNLEWPGPIYNFNDNADFYYVPSGPFRFGGDFHGQYLTGGQGRTDGNGRLVITLPADLLKDVDEGSRSVMVEATVFDVSQQPVAARTNVLFHAAEAYVGVSPANYIGSAGRSSSVNVITLDWHQRPLPNTTVDVAFYEREWQAVRAQEFNTYYTRWEPIDTEISRATVTTDAQGKGSASFTPPRGGSYIAVATVTDRGGRSHTSSTYLWITGAGFSGWRTDPRERRMDLVADKQEYRPGETANILVQSPFAGPVRAWVTIERGTLIEQRLITLESTSDILALPILPGYAPNVFVTIAAVQGINDANPYADMRLGVVELVVSPEQLELNVSLTPQSNLYQPGDTAVYDIVVTDYQGNPVRADLSVALVDLAVLMLKEDNAPHILAAFYSRQPYRSQTGSGLFYSGEGLEVEIPLEQGGMGGGGGDMRAEESAVLESDDDVRRDFRDTAYWAADISTDANGRARVEIPLPDNLTTWRLSSKAATTATLVGQGQVDVISTLPLLVRPVTPRFFTVGDSLRLGAIVHNNTTQSLAVAVSLEAGGLTSMDSLQRTVTVPAGGRELVQWQVTVEDVQYADLTFRAAAGELGDASKPTFGIGPDQLVPVYRYSAPDIVGSSGVLDSAGRRVEAILLPANIDTRRGEVRLQVNASLAAALIDTLAALERPEYDFACAHSIIDLLLPNLATAQALQALNVNEPAVAARLSVLIDDGLKQLARLQRGNGGWGWCYSIETDEFMSAYVLLGLIQARQAGYTVDEGVIDRAIDYLNGRVQPATRLNERHQINRQAFYLYVLAQTWAADGNRIDALFDEHRALLDPYAKALLAQAYEFSGNQGNNQRALLADLNDSVILSATGAHWEDAEKDWHNLSSDIRGTAMILAVLARIQPDNPMAPPAVNWLMVARTANRWPSNHETAWAVLALSQWMAATGELNADYSYQVNVNGSSLSRGQFNRANITDSDQMSVATADLRQSGVNFFDFQRGEGNGRLYYSAHLQSYVDAADVQAVNRGFTVQRLYYDAACDPDTQECQPITSIKAGQMVRVELTVILPHDRLYVIVEDPIPAGAEAIDPSLETTVSTGGGRANQIDLEYSRGYWGWWYFNRIEYRDNRVVFTSDFLPAGTYQYTYSLQTILPGAYQVIPATAREEFFPEVFGRSDGQLFTITN
jgi:alpha-2-macroglobulin